MAGRNKQAKAKSEGELKEIVKCPPELSAVSRQEWDRIAPELAANGRLTPLARGPLAVYCAAYAQWLEAVEAIQSYGTVMKSPSGYPVQSPYVSIASKQAEIMIKIATEFGFTPASSGRIPTDRKSDCELIELSSIQELAPWPANDESP